MNKDMNNIGIRHDRPMTMFEVEMAAINMREVERSMENSRTPNNNIVSVVLDHLSNIILGITVIAVLFAIIFMR